MEQKNRTGPRLTRRTLLGTGAALVAAACAPSPPATGGSPAATGATGAPTPAGATTAPKPTVGGQPGPTAGSVVAAARPKVNQLVISVPGPAREGNAPGRDFTAPEAVQLRPMYEYLVGIDAKTGSFIPQLATEWSLEPDGKSYRFKLRQGVQFQKGHGSFTARDVVWSWEDITAADSQHSNSGYFKRIVQKIDVVNDYEVVFQMASGDADFLNSLSELVGGMEIQSKAHFDKVGRPPTMQEEPIVGTGPYQFKERTQGQYVRFERVPYQHWRVAPDFPALELRWVREPSTRLASLLAGEVHMALLSNDLQQNVLGQNTYKLVKGNVAGLRTFMPFLGVYLNDIKDPAQGYKNPDSPMMDPRVRQALNHAVNRDEMNKAFFAGKGELIYVNNQHPTLPGWNPDWVQKFPAAYGYDPARAKSLLAEAGFGPSNPLRLPVISMALTDVPESADVTEAVAGYLRAVGVEVDLQSPDPATHNTKRRNLGYDVGTDIRSTASHQLVGWRVYNTSQHGIRGSAVEVPEIDALYRKAQAELDDASRADIWKQMGDVSFDSFQQINLFWLPTELVVNSSVVADYQFPGNISGSWTHLENVKAA